MRSTVSGCAAVRFWRSLTDDGVRQGARAERAAGQASLFDLLDEADAGEVCSVPIPDIPEFDQEEILKSEKELLGFYVTGHPLDYCAELVRAYASVPLRDLDKLNDNAQVRLTGMVGSFTQKFSKNSGKQFGILQLEDLDSSAECMIYERALNTLIGSGIEMLPGTPLLLEATVSKRDEAEKPRVIVDRVVLLGEAPAEITEELHLQHLRLGDHQRKAQAGFRGLFPDARRHPGGGLPGGNR